MHVRVISADLSDIEGFQSGVLLQDKELVPHPASFHPLQKRRPSCRLLLPRVTQKAVGQEGQDAEDNGEQDPPKMEPVSHRSTWSWRLFSWGVGGG